MLALLLIGLTFKNSDLWIDTIYFHATTLLIDVSIPAAAIYLIYIAKKSMSKTEKQYSCEQSFIILLATLVIVNILNQFPLSDRGHKWWSAAPSVILLAYLSHVTLENKKLGINRFNFKKRQIRFSGRVT
jgi:hypothetical protein